MSSVIFKANCIKGVKKITKCLWIKNSFIFPVVFFTLLILIGSSLSQESDNWPPALIYSSLVYHSQSGDILLLPGIRLSQILSLRTGFFTGRCTLQIVINLVYGADVPIRKDRTPTYGLLIIIRAYGQHLNI